MQVTKLRLKNASIIIQAAARTFLARVQITKLRLKKDYQTYIAGKREAKLRQEVEILIMQDRIDAKKRRAEVEFKAMRKTSEEKTAPFLREDIYLEVEEKLRLEFEEAGAGNYDYDDEIVFALEEEQRQLLVAEMEEQALLDEAMREANDKLEKANSDVTKMFKSMNDFTTKDKVSNIKLCLAETKLVEGLLPKIQRNVGQKIIEAEIATRRQIEVYKRYMQKILNGVH